MILTVFKRGHLLREQLRRLAASSLRPAAVWVWQTGAHTDVRPILREAYPSAALIQVTGHDFMYHGRFLPALQAETQHLCILDDDALPGREYLASGLAELARLGPRGAVGCDGRSAVYAGPRFSSFSYEHGDVDFPIHCYLFRTELARAFWALPPYTFTNGEDIQFGAALQIVARARMHVPPEARGEARGDTSDGTLGIDAVAAHKRKGHHEVRAELVRYWMSLGWRPRRAPGDAGAKASSGRGEEREEVGFLS